MIDVEHTPGPWLVHVGDPGSGPWDRMTIGFGKDHDVIATINRHWPEADSNARLISAAPEMLETLLEFVSLFAPPARSIGYEVKQKALDVIEKATGERCRLETNRDLEILRNHGRGR